MTDFLAELFPADAVASPEHAAYLEAHAAEVAAHAARVAANKAAEARRLASPCGRCNGSGRMPMFSHVSGGVCFGCFGAGYAS